LANSQQCLASGLQKKVKKIVYCHVETFFNTF